LLGYAAESCGIVAFGRLHEVSPLTAEQQRVRS
jgi:hypothetical protein